MAIFIYNMLIHKFQAFPTWLSYPFWLEDLVVEMAFKKKLD
jgi:hypothetical protein